MACKDYERFLELTETEPAIQKPMDKVCQLLGQAIEWVASQPNAREISIELGNQVVTDKTLKILAQIVATAIHSENKETSTMETLESHDSETTH